MTSNVHEVEVGESEIRSSFGVVRTSTQLSELLLANQIKVVRLLPLPGVGQQTIAKTVYELLRNGIKVTVTG